MFDPDFLERFAICIETESPEEIDRVMPCVPVDLFKTIGFQTTEHRLYESAANACLLQTGGYCYLEHPSSHSFGMEEKATYDLCAVHGDEMQAFPFKWELLRAGGKADGFSEHFDTKCSLGAVFRRIGIDKPECNVIHGDNMVSFRTKINPDAGKILRMF